MNSQELRAIEASKKELSRKATRDRQTLTRLLCGTFLALALASTFAALQSGQATPTLISAQAATMMPETETVKAVAVLVTPKQRKPRRQRRAARKAVARKAPACGCECGPQVARK
jgi:hypothetical protein